MKSNSMAVLKRKLRASLKLRGMSDDVITKSFQDSFEGGEAKLASIPRNVKLSMLTLFRKLGKQSTVAVSWGKTGKFRVYTETGYKNLMAQGKRVGSRVRIKKVA